MYEETKFNFSNMIQLDISEVCDYEPVTSPSPNSGLLLLSFYVVLDAHACAGSIFCSLDVHAVLILAMYFLLFQVTQSILLL